MPHQTHPSETERFKYKPAYRLAMSKRTKSKYPISTLVKEEDYDIPDQDHLEVFLAKNILS